MSPKKPFFFNVLFILFTLQFYAQVGIGTTNPTKDLDINGELRIRTTPNATSSGNKILSVDTSGNVQQLKTAELLTNISGTLDSLSLNTTGTTHNDDFFNITLTQDALVNITYNVTFSKLFDASGSNITDGSSKIYGTTLYYRPSTSGTYLTASRISNNFSNSTTPYMSGVYTINDSVNLFLTAGTYNFVLRRRIADSVSSNGFSVQIDGTSTLNRIQAVAFYN